MSLADGISAKLIEQGIGPVAVHPALNIDLRVHRVGQELGRSVVCNPAYMGTYMLIFSTPECVTNLNLNVIVNNVSIFNVFRI